MLTRIVILSLIITALHACCWDGMILHKPAEWFGGLLDKAHLSVLRKPLFECLICMGGIYTLVLDPLLFDIVWWWVLPDMLAVIGLNTITTAVICRINE